MNWGGFLRVVKPIGIWQLLKLCRRSPRANTQIATEFLDNAEAISR
jgi:hypothetical protein